MRRWCSVSPYLAQPWIGFSPPQHPRDHFSQLAFWDLATRHNAKRPLVTQYPPRDMSHEPTLPRDSKRDPDVCAESTRTAPGFGEMRNTQEVPEWAMRNGGERPSGQGAHSSLLMPEG